MDKSKYFKFRIGYFFPKYTRFIFFLLLIYFSWLFIEQVFTYLSISRDEIPFLIIIFISSLTFFLQEIIIVDLDRNRLKYYYSFLGLQFGYWEEIPDKSRIILDLYKIKYSSGAQDVLYLPDDNMATTTSLICKIKLFLPDHNNQVTLAKGRKKDKLINKIHPIAKVLNIEIEDLTVK